MSYPDARRLTAAGLSLAVDGPVLTVTLARPEVRNAQTPLMWSTLADIGRSVGDDVRVVVLRAAGTSFSAGLDRAMLGPHGIEGQASFAEIAAMSDEAAVDTIAGYQQGFTWWRDPRFISVAAVQGHAVGAGFQLALACDLRVLADDARLAMREPALGLVPDLSGTKPLVDLVGVSRALEICATTRWVEADEAAAWGLASAVVPRAELDRAVDDLVAALTAAPAAAVRATHELLAAAPARSYDAQLRAERQAQVALLRDLVRLMRAG
uniref:Enoyl-CoA hydratase n=1 Tax=uncultured Nocardioidaceae bacterium TaxID=253824 RepID=A0A6J4LL08_9ACTN|nr:MAG: Enoyl-CoA hydratase [uncultured Nocardioidaceae bacterium]